MEEKESKIKVETKVPLSRDKVWELWTKPEHITKWNFASKDWCCPAAENDLKEGGKFSWRMEAKDGSMGFDYSGTYKEVNIKKKIVKNLDDGRKVEIEFIEEDDATLIKETFEPETQNSRELQEQGWQAILDNFKKNAINKN